VYSMVRIKINQLGNIDIENGKSIYDAVYSYDKKIAKKAIAAEIITSNGISTDNIVDINYRLDKDTVINIITPEDKKALDILNHSCAHIMAYAIKRIYPEVRFAIGPSIKNGFYYDLDLDKTISPHDLPIIEREMKKIISENHKFERKEITKAEAKRLFKDNSFKLELIDEIADKVVSIYTTGEFVDLCRGPHIPSSGKVGAFKLLSIAGAYWKK